MFASKSNCDQFRMGIVRELCDNGSTDWLKLFLDGVVGDTQRKTLVYDRENAC